MLHWALTWTSVEAAGGLNPGGGPIPGGGPDGGLTGGGADFGGPELVD